MKKTKGIEIKKVGNNYYAYRVTMVWDKQLKRRRKIPRYLGKWINGKIVRTTKRRLGGVYEFGNIA